MNLDKKIVRLYKDGFYFDLFDLLVNNNLKIDCGFVYDNNGYILKLTDNITSGYLLEKFFNYYCITRFYE